MDWQQGDTVWSYGVLLLAGGLATQPWRWLGIVLGARIDVRSEAFKWTRAVSTAIVAALIAQLLVFPSGSLGQVPLGVRAAAYGAGVVVYLAGGRSLMAGVGASLAVLTAGQWWLGGP